jgi:hypothetical protein
MHLPFRTDILMMIEELHGPDLRPIDVLLRPQLPKALGQCRCLRKIDTALENETVQARILFANDRHARIVECEITSTEDNVCSIEKLATTRKFLYGKFKSSSAYHEIEASLVRGR